MPTTPGSTSVSRWAPHFALPPLLRLLGVALNLGLGLLPTAAFFIWIERNAALPILPIQLHWPWIALGRSLPDRQLLVASITFDFFLILAFGFFHTLLAQRKAVLVLERVIPPQLIRTVYVAVSGITVLGVMGYWQHTGITLWNLSLPSNLSRMVLSFALYWGLMLISLKQASRFGLLSFIGLTHLYSYAKDVGVPAGNPKLITEGLFAWVRHPVYSVTLLAFVLTPFMTLDRMIVFLASFAYLSVAIPIEEKKLVALFGQSYVDYQKRVSAVLPVKRLLGAQNVASSRD
ncbi:MAG: hypothetical protein H7222_02155 [Methylotenera sp.]|nr:hypothetical protein [Oligoflexia bacterium]